MKQTKTDLQCRQVLLNCEAWLHHYDIQEEWDGPPLAVFTDRVIWQKPRWWATGLIEDLVGDGILTPWSHGISSHREGGIALRGWRENVPWCSAQLIEFESAIGMDFDRANPDGGLLPLLGHAVEVAWPGRTNQFAVMKGLRKRGIRVEDAREIRGKES